MKYAKLIDGSPVYAPRKIRIGNMIYYNPKPAMLLSLGYKPVTFTQPAEDPLEGFHWEAVWTETEDQIIEDWILVRMSRT